MEHFYNGSKYAKIIFELGQNELFQENYVKRVLILNLFLKKKVDPKIPLPLDPMTSNAVEDRRLWVGNLDLRINE